MPWLVGVPREKIDWGPLIDSERCLSCGMCMNCGKQVFDWIDGKPIVARRSECVVGCSTCGNLCLSKAISFPPIGELRSEYKRSKVWSKVKRQLVANGKIPKGHPESHEMPPDDRAV